jgi:hypothetical protein
MGSNAHWAGFTAAALSLMFNPTSSVERACPGQTACRRDMARPPLDPLRVLLTEREDEGGGRGGQCAAGPWW